MPFHQYLVYDLKGEKRKHVRFLVRLCREEQSRYEDKHNVTLVYQGKVKGLTQG